MGHSAETRKTAADQNFAIRLKGNGKDGAIGVGIEGVDGLGERRDYRNERQPANRKGAEQNETNDWRNASMGWIRMPFLFQCGTERKLSFE